MGLVLLLYGGSSIIEKCDLLALVPPFWTVGIAAILFGAVLIVWTFADWPRFKLKWQWIGNDTVTMVVGVVAAMIAISAFVHETHAPAECDGAAKSPVQNAPTAK